MFLGGKRQDGLPTHIPDSEGRGGVSERRYVDDFRKQGDINAYDFFQDDPRLKDGRYFDPNNLDYSGGLNSWLTNGMPQFGKAFLGTASGASQSAGGYNMADDKGNFDIGKLVSAGGGFGTLYDAFTGKSNSKEQRLKQGDTSFIQFGPATLGEMRAGSISDRQLDQMSGLYGPREFAAAQKDAYAADSAFRDLLLGTLKNNGFASPEQITKATEYVDQTFTIPAQMQLQEQMQQLQGSYDSRAAALGRQVDDQGYNKDIAAEQAKQTANLQAQRGAFVQQRADELAFQRPMQQAQLGLHGSAFFNDRANQMLSNKINLQNLASQRESQLFNQRQAQGIQVGNRNVSQSNFEQGSLGNRINGTLNAVGSLYGAAKSYLSPSPTLIAPTSSGYSLGGGSLNTTPSFGSSMAPKYFTY